MKIAIVGGTSQIAMELAVRFENTGHTAHPTVRSQVGASFYEYHDLPYVIVDIADEGEACTAISDADVVIIAAFARQYAKGFTPKRARRINKRLVQNVARHARNDSTLVYFSTITIYGNEVGYSNWDSYARGKLTTEETFLDACEKYNKNGYSFRMGPVYGPNQNKERNLRNSIEEHVGADGTLHVDCDPDRQSNVLHTVTLINAIKYCHLHNPPENVYTLVNNPPWTWRQVIEYYAPSETTIHFYGTHGDQSLTDKLFSSIKKQLEARERIFRSFLPYLPHNINQRIFNEYVKNQVANDIRELDASERLYNPEFEQDPAPGPHLSGLEDTYSLLKDDHRVREKFETQMDSLIP